MSNPTRTSLLAAAVKVGVAFIPLAIALAAVTELFTNNCEVGVKANVGEDVIELVPLK
jgi:hydroxylamine reductase (hybrid-cluster protein)